MKMPSKKAQEMFADLIESAGSDRSIYEYVAALESALLASCGPGCSHEGCDTRAEKNFGSWKAASDAYFAVEIGE